MSAPPVPFIVSCTKNIVMVLFFIVNCTKNIQSRGFKAVDFLILHWPPNRQANNAPIRASAAAVPTTVLAVYTSRPIRLVSDPAPVTRRVCCNTVGHCHLMCHAAHRSLPAVTAASRKPCHCFRPFSRCPEAPHLRLNTCPALPRQ